MKNKLVAAVALLAIGFGEELKAPPRPTSTSQGRGEGADASSAPS